MEPFPVDDEETAQDLGRLLELLPGKLAEQERRREEARQLFEELTAAPPDRQGEMLRTSRFRSLGLLDFLIEESHASQPENPPHADDLAQLAAHLAALLADTEPEAVPALALAFCLGANARRLGNDTAGADALLERAAPFLEFPSERAVYCRFAGLIRWEQGRADEAAALLSYAGRLYRSEGLGGEHGICRGLLGLLLQEEPGLGDCRAPLEEGWACFLRPEGRALPAVRVGLGLAACLADRGEADRARGLLKEVWRLYEKASDEREMLRIFWHEARVLARLGQKGEALEMLEAVRRKLVDEPSPAEMALVSLDMSLVLSESGRAAEVEALAQALLTAFPEEPTMLLAAGNLSNLGDLAALGQLGVQGRAATTLRRTFRLCGLRMRPFPFV